MPIYEYRCQDCGNHFDALRTMKNDDAQIACKVCESIHTVRQISVFFAQSGGRVIATTQSGCAGCTGGSCASCKS